MVRKGYHDKVRRKAPGIYDTKKPSIITIHDPKKRKNVKVQAVRFIGDQAYYYKNDFATKKEAKDIQKYLRESGSNAQIKKINNRYAVFSRKSKRR